MASAIRIVLLSKNVNIPLFIDNFCLRTFAFQFDKEKPSEWFSPLINPKDGLTAFSNLFKDNILVNILSFKQANSEDIFEKLDKMLLSGAVIIGPLDKTKVWNRIDSLYFKGAAYFIIITGKENEKYVVNDPSGCPFMYFSKKLLRSSFFISNEFILLFQLNVTNPIIDLKSIYSNALISGIKYRINNKNNNVLLQNGLNKFIESDNFKLKSSQEAILNFAIPNYSNFLMQLEFLIKEIIYQNEYTQINSKILKDIYIFINEYKVFLSELLFCIQNRRTKKVKELFNQLINFEYQLNELFLSV